MNERDGSCLIQYDFEVKDMKKVRAGLLCNTSEGVFLLKEARVLEKRADFENRVLKQLYLSQGLVTDSYIANKEGNFVTRMPDGKCYLLRKWYAGKECDARNEREVEAGFKALAKLHLALREVQADDTWEQYTVLPRDLSIVWEKHTRELRRARAYVKKRRSRSEYERLILNNIEKYIAQADLAMQYLEDIGLEGIAKEKQQVALCHGDYNYHHIIFGKDEIWVTQFHCMRLGYQVIDLYHFLRKILEKNMWKPQLGLRCLSCYEEILPLTEMEHRLLYLLFLYPDKYWKQINHYLNSSKSWIPERNLTKLRILENQEKLRKNFMQRIENTSLK